MRALPTTAQPWLFGALRVSGGHKRGGVGRRGYEPVPSGNDGRVGALRVGHGEEPLRLVDRRLIRPLGQEVGGEAGLVIASDTLNPDVVTVYTLKRRGKSGPNTGALRSNVSLHLVLSRRETGNRRLLTMFPSCVLPRA